VTRIVRQHREAEVQLWFMDEARVGQKGRNTHVWYERGVRPTAPIDRRFDSTYLFGAVRPGTDEAFALVLPEVSTAMMNLFLDGFSRSLSANAHAILVLDRAGWHRASRLERPANLSLIHLPAYSPEFNPAERVWQYMRENWLSHRLLDTYDDIVEACCEAWNKLTALPGVLASLTNYPYLRRVRTS